MWTLCDFPVFGYDDSGERLWRAGTNGYTVWIGGIYEINNGKVLCHVVAGGQLIATFEPQCNAGLAKVFGQKNWYVASTSVGSALSWPFKDGRGQWTIFGGAWAAVLGICLVAGRGINLNQLSRRRKPALTFNGFCRTFSFNYLWKQAIAVVSISAILLAGAGNVDAAPAYNPVFYYYLTDALGSSNILTDNSGNLVQHYEYSTFGQTSYQNNTSAFPVSNRYTGQIADDETGLYYYGGRYYDSQLGRFIQPDPTIPDPTDSQSYNRYSYCRNNPLNETDPSGFDDSGGDGSDYFAGYDGFSGSSGFGFTAGPDFTVYSQITQEVDAPGQALIATLWYTPNSSDTTALPAIPGTSDYGAINNYASPWGGGFPQPTFDGFPNTPTPNTGSSWLSGAGHFVADSVLNADLLQQSWYELHHPDFSNGWGIATYAIAAVGLPAGIIDAGSNLIPGKAVVESLVKGGVKDLGKLLLHIAGKEGEELTADAAKPIARDPFHHIFPQRPDLAAEFRARGINPDDFTMQIPRDLHIDIHSGGSRGGAWNQAWEDYFRANPGATASDIYKQAGKMLYEFRIPGGPVVPYP